MAEQARIETILDDLNAALGSVTPYKLALAAPADLVHVEKNARYMSKGMIDQLAENVSKDGNLASLPFCWRKEDGSFIVLSGNHRKDAAEAAGIAQVLILYTDEVLSNSQARAIQLSHNSLSGQDNPTILRELWAEIGDLEFRVYSGLDEQYLQTIDPVSIISIKDEALRFEVLSLYFIPPEIGLIEEVVERLGESARSRFVNDLGIWDKFWDRLLDFKEAANVLNTSSAFMLLIDIADEWMEHNKLEHE